MADFHGVFPYLVSPVDADGKIRTDVLGRLCDDLIKSRVHGLTPLGSIGQVAYPRIGYIKDASTNTGRLLSIMSRCGDAIRVFSASAHIPAAVMLIGGVGWMAGPACIIPRQSVELYNLCKAARWDEALTLQRRLWRINEAFARYNLAACIKAGLAIQGYDVGDPLPPQAALSGDERKAVEAVLREMG